VASGVIESAGVPVSVTAGNVTVTAAHATLPRLDLVTVSSAGTKAVTAGTAASPPLLPTIAAGDVALAAVFVPPSVGTITSDRIIDKRVILNTPKRLIRDFSNQHGTLTGSATFGIFATNGSAYDLPDTGTSGVAFTAHAPPLTYGLGALRFRFSITGTSTNNVVLRLTTTYGPGAGSTSTVTSPAAMSVTQAGPGVANQLFEIDYVSIFGGTTLPPANSWIQFQIERLPGNASDTNAGTVNYHGAILEWNT
jgi:hypothetical protein